MPQLEKLRHALGRHLQMDDSAWHAASELFKIKPWQAGEHIFRAGETPRRLYFILEGFGRYYYLTPQGKECNKSLTRPGSLFACMHSLIANQPSPFSTQALTDNFTACISYRDMTKLADNYSAWNHLTRMLLEGLAIKKERREASFLMQDAQQRYQGFLREYGNDAQHFPLYQVARYLGITDVALSRIRARMGLTEVKESA
ncbi:Crp/Fnr family transcriptional regulator [Bowmanella yangjiangensis]|uniref:Crp/Fnr family transcriptional regulator n=1 Tax=Bowmanella yangjiangensis TaxID=2811230 RepID=A0ABS3CTN3_9ALTE|nr:Crp/Fnr family transcriptional regulator [Bowmanella yangjiangensis]MBN7819975.1 Crp/Fnr family transcriptional regulator [Bowmanella yangjiangensis]